MKIRSCGIALAFAIGSAGGALASSHREAPLISEDPMADNTDVYAFISPSNPDNIVLVANSVPMLLPSSGPNFHRFAENVAYDILLDNDGDAQADIAYRWQFETRVRNGATFLYNTGPVESVDDPDLNVFQIYTLRRFDRNAPLGAIVAAGVPVAPWNVGDRSFPSGYESVARQAIFDDGRMKVFAGPRDEPFFVDLGIFDLLGVGNATPSTDGLNVMSLVLEVPIADVAAGGVRPPANDAGPTSVLGVYARNLRRVVEIRREFGPTLRFGRQVQVSRLAIPLVNEVLIPLQAKDRFNQTSPADDFANFGPYFLDPQLNVLLRDVLGVTCPPTPPGGRTDIIGILSPNGTAPADLLRIGITQGQTFADTAFPNGRRLEDDVVDTVLTLVCSADFSIPVGDGVGANDVPFSTAFPYLAPPHSGNPFP